MLISYRHVKEKVFRNLSCYKIKVITQYLEHLHIIHPCWWFHLKCLSLKVFQDLAQKIFSEQIAHM